MSIHILSDVFGDDGEDGDNPLGDGMLADPVGFALVDTNDIDSLYRSLMTTFKTKKLCDEWIAELKRRIAEFSDEFMAAFADRQAGDPTTPKTFRVRGKDKTYIVEMPGDYWDQRTLKAAWADPRFEDIRDEILRVDRIAPQMTSFKKAVRTDSTDPLFRSFVEEVRAAFRGPSGSPMIKLDENASKKQKPKGTK